MPESNRGVLLLPVKKNLTDDVQDYIFFKVYVIVDDTVRIKVQ